MDEKLLKEFSEILQTSGESSREAEVMDQDERPIIDSETTMKYLTGQMSFEEYNLLLESTSTQYQQTTQTVVPVAESVVEVEPVESSSDDVIDEGSTLRGTIKVRRARQLPRELAGLMGEANMKVARGEYDEALKMCMEIVRQAPNFAEPSQTLAMIYEEMGDAEKCFQFSLIGAHLRPTDTQSWLHVAELSMEKKDIQKALHLYAKALKTDRNNQSLWWTVCELLEQIGDNEQALEGYQRVLELLPLSDTDKYLKLARQVTKKFHDSNNIDKALDTMVNLFAVHPTYVDIQDVNVLLELYILKSIYNKPLEIFVQHCGVCFYYSDHSILAADPDTHTMSLPAAVPVRFISLTYVISL